MICVQTLIVNACQYIYGHFVCNFAVFSIQKRTKLTVLAMLCYNFLQMYVDTVMWIYFGLLLKLLILPYSYDMSEGYIYQNTRRIHIRCAKRMNIDQSASVLFLIPYIPNKHRGQSWRAKPAIKWPKTVIYRWKSLEIPLSRGYLETISSVSSYMYMRLEFGRSAPIKMYEMMNIQTKMFVRLLHTFYLIDFDCPNYIYFVILRYIWRWV